MAPPSIDHALGFASARAGVGKTALVVELAAWFASRGHTVALLDADLGAPDALGRMGAAQGPGQARAQCHGVACFSLGRALEERGLAGVGGELLEQQLARLLEDGLELGRHELLLVDLAPGAETNEEWLEALGIDALVGVAREGEELALESEVPVLGRIETFTHDAPGARAPRGPRGATLLGRIPFDARLRELGSRGAPLVLEDMHSPAAHALAQAGAQLWKRVQNRLSA